MNSEKIKWYSPFALIGLISEGKWWPYYLILPSLLMVGAIIFYPTLSGIILSFRQYQPILNPGDYPFIGLDNYIEILTQDDAFWWAMQNTLIWVVSAVLIELVLGIITALALSQPLPGMKILSSLLIIPWVLPTVVAGNMWNLLLDSRIGVINDILYRLGIIDEFIAWFVQRSTSMPAVIGIEAWHGFPFFCLLVMAGLKSIPDDLYEAGKIDGTTAIQAFFYITLPMLKPILVAAIVLRVIALFNSPVLLLILTQGGPGHSTNVISLYAFLKAYEEFDFGYSGALSTIMFICLMTFSYFYVKISKV